MAEVLLFLISIGAGFLGAILGLGGGIIIVPVLTLYYGVNIRYAIAASLISIVATSSGAAASYLKDSLTNLPLAVFLEMGTVSGAIVGFLIASSINAKALTLIFGIFLLVSAVMMLKKRKETPNLINHPWADALGLDGEYPHPDPDPDSDSDSEKKKMITYKVANVPKGLFGMFLAGILSALLGIGSGILKVTAMDGVMKLPIKVSSATSNFMIGVTAAASAGAYFLRGDVEPIIAGPVALGIIIGSFSGAKVMVKLSSTKIRVLFVIILTIVSVQMIYKGLGLATGIQ